jgi:hypothetical protein
MSLVERWFGHCTTEPFVAAGAQRGDLQASIAAFLQAWNRNPQPFMWTATAESIQEKLNRCRRTLERIQAGLRPAVLVPSPENGSSECSVI